MLWAALRARLQPSRGGRSRAPPAWLARQARALLWTRFVMQQRWKLQAGATASLAGKKRQRQMARSPLQRQARPALRWTVCFPGLCSSRARSRRSGRGMRRRLCRRQHKARPLACRCSSLLCQPRLRSSAWLSCRFCRHRRRRQRNAQPLECRCSSPLCLPRQSVPAWFCQRPRRYGSGCGTRCLMAPPSRQVRLLLLPCSPAVLGAPYIAPPAKPCLFLWHAQDDCVHPQPTLWILVSACASLASHSAGLPGGVGCDAAQRAGRGVAGD